MSAILEAQTEQTEVIDDEPELSERSVSLSDKSNDINMQQSQSGSASASLNGPEESLDQEQLESHQR